MSRRTDQTPDFGFLAADMDGTTWSLQMQQLTDRLRQLHASPLLAYDVVAQSIFRDIAMAPDMEEISRQCDLLLVRIDELLQEDASSRFIDTAPARASRVMMKL